MSSSPSLTCESCRPTFRGTSRWRVSGACEILGGLGLFLPTTRRAAAWGLVALLIAMFPANIFMAIHPIESGAASIAPVLRWGRLPLQLVLIWWLLWCTKPRYVLR